MVNPMIFLTDTKIKSKIIKSGEELIENQKFSLNKLLNFNDGNKKEKEIQNSIEEFTSKSQKQLEQYYVNTIFSNYNDLKIAIDRFLSENQNFLTPECQQLIYNIFYTSNSLAIILSGIMRVENSHLINDDIKSVKLAYEGIDRIAISIENQITFIPKYILLELKKTLRDIHKNTTKYDSDKTDYFYDEDDNKIYFVNRLVAIKRACNSTIYLIEQYLKNDREEKIADLYLDEESFDYIGEQQRQFERMDKNLLEKYEGQFIYVENGEILDSDSSEEKLTKRAMKNVGSKNIFITKV